MPERQLTEEEAVILVRSALRQADWEEYNRRMIERDRLRMQKLQGFLMAAAGVMAGIITFMISGCLIKTVWMALCGILPGIGWMIDNNP